jgi:hypothetical protein
MTKNFLTCKYIYIKKIPAKPGMVVHTYNPSTREAEAERW